MGLTPIPIPAEGYRANMNDWERVPGRVPKDAWPRIDMSDWFCGFGGFIVLMWRLVNVSAICPIQ